MTLEEKIEEYERLIENVESKLAKIDSPSGVPYYSAPMRETWMSAVMAWQDAISLLRELKEYREKPKRRIETMSEEELADMLASWHKAVDGACGDCPISTAIDCDECGKCDKKFAHYLLSSADSKIIGKDGSE